MIRPWSFVATGLVAVAAALASSAVLDPSAALADDEKPAKAAAGDDEADDDEGEPSADEEEPGIDEQVQELLEDGLVAELEQDFAIALASYSKAAELDPEDPVPLRFVGELQRVHLGDWAAAKVAFEKALALVEAQSARARDKVTEAIACHGLGKILVTEENYRGGMDYFKRSIKAHPTALCYRNMAIHMTYVKQDAIGQSYAKKALALEPNDPFNKVFYARFQALGGDAEGALKILGTVEPTADMFYNVAAIHALSGDAGKAIDFLGRYLTEFIDQDAARERWKFEAQGDRAFESLRADEKFLALTKASEKKD